MVRSDRRMEAAPTIRWVLEIWDPRVGGASGPRPPGLMFNHPGRRPKAPPTFESRTWNVERRTWNSFDLQKPDVGLVPGAPKIDGPAVR